MGLRLQVEIKESQEELEKAVKYARDGSNKERLQMLYWLKSGQVTNRGVLLHKELVSVLYSNCLLNSYILQSAIAPANL